MELVKIRRHYQITIPQGLRKLIKVAEGDYVEVDVQGGVLIIRPIKVVHPEQEYFFTKEWQEKELEADRDIATGRLAGPAGNLKEALEVLNKTKV